MSSAGRRPLTTEEKDHFDKHGYVIVRGVFQDEDFAGIERDYGELIDQKANELFEKGLIKNLHKDVPFSKRFAKIAAECDPEVMVSEINPFGLTLDTMYALQPGMFAFFFNQRLLDCVESIVGPEITLNPIQHFRPYLPARNNVQVQAGAAVWAPWHQDQGVTREEADASEILTCWIPLVDIEDDLGLMVLPDYVEKGLLPHVKKDYGTTIDPSIIAKDHKGVPCGMKRGDLLFMNRYTPHRGQLNHYDKVRWSLDCRFQKTGTPTGRHFWPEYVLRSESGKHRVQNDFKEWKNRWVTCLENSKGERWHRVAGDVGGAYVQLSSDDLKS
eukprot:m.24201 g.24201  ORF g.24201 m.24201 type:complete len:329 (+) comp7585_c0_seq1:131-1117(+)